MRSLLTWMYLIKTTQEVAALKEHYERGGLGDVALKKRLIEVLEEFLTPIRNRRAEYEKNTEYVENVLKRGH